MAIPTRSRAYIAEWMTSVGLIQADLVNRLGWSKAKANAIWHGDQRVNEDILDDVAPLVNAQAYELMMPPGRAHQLRRIEAILNDAIPQPVPAKPDPAEPVKLTPHKSRKAS